MDINDQREKYIKENPIDYVKFLEALDYFYNDAFNTIYKIIKYMFQKEFLSIIL